MNEPRLGVRFSQNYLLRTDLLSDSVRMRRRVGKLIGSQYFVDFRDILERELGISLPTDLDRYAFCWPDRAAEMELRDFLDMVTIVYRNIKNQNFTSNPAVLEEKKLKYLIEARRIFREEQVAYRIDDGGGVHFLIDAEFEYTRAAVVSGLGEARYKAALSLFEAAMASLDASPTDPKGGNSKHILRTRRII